MKSRLIFIFFCLSYFAFSQDQADSKTIPELEGKIQKIIENGLNLEKVTRKNTGAHDDYYWLVSDLIDAYTEIEDYERCLDLCYHLLDINYTTHLAPTYKILVLNRIGNIIQRKDFKLAEESYLEAIKLAKECVKTGRKIKIKYPQYRKPLLLYSKKEMRETCKNILDLTINNLSALYINYGFTEKALEYMLSLEITSDAVAAANVPGSYAKITNIGGLYNRLGDYNKAHKYFLKALQILEVVNNDMKKRGVRPIDDKEINSLITLSYSYNILGDQDSASFFSQKAMELCIKEYGVNHSVYAMCLENKASITEMTRKERLALYDKIDDIYFDKFGPESVPYFNNLGKRIHYLTYNYKGENKIYIDSLLQISLEPIKDFFGLNSTKYIDLLTQAAGYYLRTGDYANERACLEKSIPGLIANYKAYEGQMNTNYTTQIYSQLLKNCMNLSFYAWESTWKETQQSSYSQALSHFNLCAYVKGKGISNERRISYNVYNSDNKETIGIYEDWCRIKRNISVCFEKDKYERALLGFNIEKLQDEANNKERQLLQSLGSIFMPSDANLFTKITSELEDNEVYIDVMVSGYGGAYYAYLIEHDDTIPKLISLGSDSSLNSIYNYYSNYTKERPSRHEFSDGDEHHGNICYDNFWGKLEPYLEDVSTVYFSPDGVYSKINPNVLYDSTSSSFLIDKYDIVHVSNVEDFVHQKENIQLFERPDDLHAVVIGNPTFLLEEDVVVLASNEPQSRSVNQDELDSLQRGMLLSDLPGTQTEIDLISDNLKSKGWDVEVISGIDATETRVKSIEAPKILHIATHGFFFEDQEMIKRSNMISTDNKKAVANPMTRSGLVFAGAQNTMNGEILADDNGWLNSHEASLLNLRGTELVVLSACETGSGDVQNGKGVYGLQRAIRVAGAESLIMSMWEVDDKATQELMTYFYDYWIDKKMSKKEAFKEAQQKIREKYKHPYYWGAFIMLGE